MNMEGGGLLSVCELRRLDAESFCEFKNRGKAWLASGRLWVYGSHADLELYST
jgi:hypothetical protein